MQVYQGKVTQIHGASVVGGSTDNVGHRHYDLSIRFGAHTLRLTPKSLPPIHAGDELLVYGFQRGGMVRPVLLRNLANGYEAGSVTWTPLALSVVLSAVGLVMLPLGLKSSSVVASLAGLALLATAPTLFVLRRKAVAALDRP